MYNHQLDTFIRVADAGSFSKAAGDSFITSQAVIKQITLMEHRLGMRLFERTHHGVILTAAGRSLYQDAKRMIRFSQDALERARTAAQNVENTIRVGTSFMTPIHFLADLWPKIQQISRQPQLQLIPFENTPEKAKDILSNLGQNIDIVALPFDPADVTAGKYAALELSRAVIRCAVPRRHPLAEKELLEIGDLYGEELMIMRRGWNSCVDQLREDLQKNHLEIKLKDVDFYDIQIFNQCENTNSLLVVIGDWENVHPLMKILPVNWDYQVPFGLIHAVQPSTRVQFFLSVVEQALES